MQLSIKKIRIVFLFIFLAELLSFLGYLAPEFQLIIFFAIVLLTLFLSLIDLKYGVWIILAELFISSKGYLFFFEYDGLIISIRIALWLVVMAVWLAKLIKECIKSRTAKEESELFSGLIFKQSSYFYYFFILFLFIIWGLVNGFLNSNEFNNVFFDFNGWLYFTLVFPFYSAIKNKQCINNILQIFTASIIWLSLKTFFLLFIFSHSPNGIASYLYRWVRLSGVGEITQMQGGFYRIFFQSHIFILIGFFLFLIIFTLKIYNKNNQKKLFLFSYFLFLTFLLATNLISFSRSFWVGLIAGLIMFYVYLIWQKYSLKRILQNVGLLLFIFIISISFIISIVKFPYPNPTSGFTTTELFAQRATQITSEAGVSSRWSLLPKLWSKIKEKPILGQGFGATVTYKSSDPRVLQSSPTGDYTTYAFEWGWLDLWLKLGIFGLLSYLFLLGKICLSGIKIIKKDITKKHSLIMGLIIGLILIAVVSIFSPYINHPLGIGYLILASIMVNKEKLLA